MCQRADERPLVAALREHRQVLADLDAGRLRRDRMELAAYVVRRMGLQIETVLLRETARQEDINAGLGFAKTRGICFSRRRLAQSLQVVHA